MGRPGVCLFPCLFLCNRTFIEPKDTKTKGRIRSKRGGEKELRKAKLWKLSNKKINKWSVGRSGIGERTEKRKEKSQQLVEVTKHHRDWKFSHKIQKQFQSMRYAFINLPNYPSPVQSQAQPPQCHPVFRLLLLFFFLSCAPSWSFDIPDKVIWIFWTCFSQKLIALTWKCTDD